MTTNDELTKILDNHRHYCTQPDKFSGMSDSQAKTALLALIQRAEVEGRINELKRIKKVYFLPTQDHYRLDRRIELLNQGEEDKVNIQRATDDQPEGTTII